MVYTIVNVCSGFVTLFLHVWVWKTVKVIMWNEKEFSSLADSQVACYCRKPKLRDPHCTHGAQSLHGQPHDREIFRSSLSTKSDFAHRSNAGARP